MRGIQDQASPRQLGHQRPPQRCERAGRPRAAGVARGAPRCAHDAHTLGVAHEPEHIVQGRRARARDHRAALVDDEHERTHLDTEGLRDLLAALAPDPHTNVRGPPRCGG